MDLVNDATLEMEFGIGLALCGSCQFCVCSSARSSDLPDESHWTKQLSQGGISVR